MKFRKKPVEIEAEQFTEKNQDVKGVCTCGLMLSGIPGGCQPHVHTIHKNQRVDLEFGDWVVPEPDGKHFYPVKPDIFQATYELIT
jgi:hypothetical protein